MTSGTKLPTDVSDQTKLIIRLMDVFTPYAAKQINAFVGTKGRFVHYTTAEAALNMIRTKRLWMRNATCMADYREVRHGLDMLDKFFFYAPAQKAFIECLDVSVPGAATEAITSFCKMAL